MPQYNPNAIWDGKPKKPQSSPKPSPQPAVTPQPAKVPEVVVQEKPAPKGRAIIWVIVAFVILIGGVVMYLLLRPNGGPQVSITFVKPDQVLVGDKFVLQISLSNYSSSVLKNAALAVFLPDNVSFIGQSPGQRVMEQSLGDLGPGGITPKDFNLIVTGDPNGIKHVNAKLTYSTDASAKTHFETNGGADIVVGASAISLNVVAPTGIFSGQDFDIAITYNNNTRHSFNNVRLNLGYSPTFTFMRSSVPPNDQGSHSWNLGTIPAAGSATITVTGNIVGPPSAIYKLEAGLVGDVMGDTYPLTNETANLAISSSPLSLTILPNGKADYLSKTADNLSYAITYTNSSNATFQNLMLKATLVGDLFDFTSLRSDGAFSSLTNTITWSAANTPQLLTLPPGQSGSVSFQIRTKSAFPIHLLSDKNYTLKVNARISSLTVPPGTVASSTVSVTSLESKVGGAISLAANGYWRDAPSGILNSGPYPPKVDQPTQYTVHWVITNYATDMQNVTISAYLQSGTTCTGNIKSNVTTAPTCNSANGLITWTIPTVPATTGITGPPAEAIIQVVNTPAINQVGQVVTLLGETTLQATDAFTDSPTKASAPAVMTDLPDDKTINVSQSRKVIQ